MNVFWITRQISKSILDGLRLELKIFFNVGLLKKSAPSRIIFVSSVYAFCSNLTADNLNYPQGHPLSLFRTSLIYGNSKLANIVAANGFAERLKEYGVTSNSLHPGLINTSIYAKSAKYLGLQTLARLFRNIVLYAYGKVSYLYWRRTWN